MGRGLFYAFLVSLPLAIARNVVPGPAIGILPELTGVHLYASDALLLGALAVWIAGHVLDPTRPLRLSPRSVTAPMIALVLLAAASIQVAFSPVLAAEITLRLLGLVLLALLAAGEIDDPRPAAAALVAGAAVQSTLALVQLATQSPLGLGWLGERSAAVDQPGLWLRGSGLSWHPNILGGYLLVGLTATLGLAWTAGGRAARWGSLSAIAMFSVLTAGLLATFSRSAWMGALAGLTLIAAALATRSPRPSKPVRPADEGEGKRSPASGAPDAPCPAGDAARNGAARHPTIEPDCARTFARCLAAGALVAAGFVAARPDWFQSRLVVPARHWIAPTFSAPPPAGHVEVTNLDMRAGYDRVAWTLIAARPWRGTGASNFAIASARLEPDLPAAHAYLPVHNVPLLVAAELGVLGGVAWWALVAGIGLALVRERRGLPGSPWRLAWSAALLGLFVASLWDSYLWSWQYGRGLLFATLGLWAAAGGAPTLAESEEHDGMAAAIQDRGLAGLPG